MQNGWLEGGGGAHTVGAKKVKLNFGPKNEKGLSRLPRVMQMKGLRRNEDA
jgi:hypothetical protein